MTIIPQTQDLITPMLTITGCRSCGCADLEPILYLGKTPLANALLTKEQLSQPEPIYPLEVVFCPRCSLVQLSGTVPPEVLFRQYPYYSSFSDLVLSNARALVQRMIRERGLGRSSKVLEIGSNDGYLLINYVYAGVSALGIEPARNIAALADAKGVTTIPTFFHDFLLAPEFRNWKVDVLHANNVLAHMADLNETVAGIGRILKDDGIAIIEAPYVRDLVNQGEFDTIYHEHLSYFSVTALNTLVRRHGLMLLDVERVFVHGGTLRYFVGKHGRASDTVWKMLRAEQSVGMGGVDYYRILQEKADRISTNLYTLLHSLKVQGKRMIAYSVPAKGMTLLHLTGIGADVLDYAVDIITLKQGHYTSGTHLPIYAPERVVEDMPDYALLLAWNFADAILEREAVYRQRGGKFIIPIPEVRIV